MIRRNTPALESRKPMSHTLIFLCGLHRSGRSVLHRMLKGHPEISGFENTGAPDDEGEYLQTVYPKSRNFGGAGKFAFAPDAYMNEKSRLVSDENRDRLFKEWSEHWDLAKPFLLEKSGPNIIRARFLQALFPNSVFIFLVRHPLAVALATDKGALPDMPEHVEHWSLAHKTMMADRPYLKRHILVRYEDMIARPDHCMKILYEFLHLPFRAPNEKLIQGINKEYFRLWEEYKLGNAGLYQKAIEFSRIPAQFGYVFDTPYLNPVALETGTIPA